MSMNQPDRSAVRTPKFVPAGRIVKICEVESDSVEDAVKKEMKELQELEGIGEALAQRLVEVGYSSIAKVAAAEEHGLKSILGMDPQKVGSIVAQAREMTSSAEKNRPKNWKKSSRVQMDSSRF